MPYAPIPMIPGPTSVPPSVLAAMSRDYGSGQVEADFLDLYAATGTRLARLMGLSGDVVLMTGEGMLALWAALKSCLKAGDGVVCLVNGVFGQGIADMTEGLGCRVERIVQPFDRTLDAAALDKAEAAIRRLRPVMLTAVHCETPSGTLNPLDGLGEIKQRLGVPLFAVDAVASLGGTPVLCDAWQVDLLLAGSQKCLSAPPSMSMIGVSPGAWEIIAGVRYAGYDAILPFRTVRQDGRCPYTPYWHGVAALHAACGLLLEQGLEAVFTRHERAAARCRAGLATLGIDLFPDPAAIHSPTVTAAMVPKEYSFQQWQEALRARGLVTAGSFGPMAGKIFRLGHMGSQASEDLVDRALAALARALA